MLQEDDKLKLFEGLNLAEKLFETVRLVDPDKNEVLYNKDTSANVYEKCYRLLGKNNICSNCVSARALREKKTFVKLEHSSTGIFLAIAVPVLLNGRLVILELLKDITDSLISDNKPLKTVSEVQQLLDYTKSLVFKDSLTGLYNRRYIDETLPSDIIFAVNAKQNLCVIMADIDWFKTVNDTYGHLAGDEVLRIFAQTLQGSLRRDTDWAARYGGEEFLICLPGAKLDKAAEFAELMRKAIEDTVTVYGTDKIRITASFGVCGIDEAESKDMKNLIECADRKLYLAKQKGRNRIEA